MDTGWLTSEAVTWIQQNVHAGLRYPPNNQGFRNQHDVGWPMCIILRGPLPHPTLGLGSWSMTLRSGNYANDKVMPSPFNADGMGWDEIRETLVVPELIVVCDNDPPERAHMSAPVFYANPTPLLWQWDLILQGSDRQAYFMAGLLT